VPFGRHGTGWEVVCAALFLISNESSYANAHTLFPGAGHMAGIVRSSSAHPEWLGGLRRPLQCTTLPSEFSIFPGKKT
jgi:hypothetical protein